MPPASDAYRLVRATLGGFVPRGSSAHWAATPTYTPLRWRLAVAALVVSGVAYLTWTFLPPGLRIGDPTLVSDIAFLPGSFLVALLAWHASAARDISSGARRGWRWIAVAYGLFWIGDALWLVYEVILVTEPSPSLADVAYLAYYPALVIGLLSFPRVIRSSIERARFGLDAATIVLGGAMVAWFFVIGPVASAEHASPLDAFLAAAYPVGDLVVLFGVVIVALRAPRDVPRAAVVALLTGLVAYLAADTIYGVQALNDTYAGGGFVDALYVSAWTLTGIGAYLAASRPDDAADIEARPTDAVPLVPYLAVGIGYAMLLAALSHDWTPAVAGLVAGAGGLTVLSWPARSWRSRRTSGWSARRRPAVPRRGCARWWSTPPISSWWPMPIGTSPTRRRRSDAPWASRRSRRSAGRSTASSIPRI